MQHSSASVLGEGCVPSCHHNRLHRVDELNSELIFQCSQCSGIFKLTLQTISASNLDSESSTVFQLSEESSETSIETSYAESLKEFSQLKRDFEFVELLGSGNYGAVGKFKNKLDGKFYAIKKIEYNKEQKDLGNDQLDEKIMREIQLLSALNHENIVRYFNCWIEPQDSFPVRYRLDVCIF